MHSSLSRLREMAGVRVQADKKHIVSPPTPGADSGQGCSQGATNSALNQRSIMRFS